MKWNADDYKKLLEVWCQTHQNTVNVTTIAANWPVDSENDERPTPEAIKKRFQAFKDDMKPGASLSISFGSKDSQPTDDSLPVPRKRKASAGKKSAKKAKTSKEPVDDDEE